MTELGFFDQVASFLHGATGERGLAIRIATIVVVAGGAHLFVRGVRRLGQALAERRVTRSFQKIRTIGTLVESVAVFFLYFCALGLVLNELGVSLTAYLASASIVGLAIGFGSQGFVQDVVTGLTLVFSDLFDVGDMVEIAGQSGIVRRLGLRFTVLINGFGAEVYIPNRTIANVVNYPRGYVRCLFDITLPAGNRDADEILQRLEAIAQSIYDQLPGVVLLPPSIEGRFTTKAGRTYVRVKFRIWPGRGDAVERAFRPEALQALQRVDPSYADWMIAITYEAEAKPVGVSWRRQ